jgi:hypothetical protein
LLRRDLLAALVDGFRGVAFELIELVAVLPLGDRAAVVLPRQRCTLPGKAIIEVERRRILPRPNRPLTRAEAVIQGGFVLEVLITARRFRRMEIGDKLAPVAQPASNSAIASASTDCLFRSTIAAPRWLNTWRGASSLGERRTAFVRGGVSGCAATARAALLRLAST